MIFTFTAWVMHNNYDTVYKEIVEKNNPSLIPYHELCLIVIRKLKLLMAEFFIKTMNCQIFGV